MDIKIPDENLVLLLDEVINRHSMRKRELNQKVLSKIRYLNANYRGIGDLSGIENLVNLETLYLSWNSFRDLTPLSKLPKLRRLDLSGNPQIDWAGLDVTFDSVEYLDIRSCMIESDEFLKHFPNLKEVSLYNNRIRSINMMYNLERLESVDLRHNSVSDEEIEVFINHTGCCVQAGTA